jgi:hypothetical protein
VSDGVFTGIVEELGKVAELSGSRLRISAHTVLDGSKIGSSIAVNGCCLTVVSLDQQSWITDVSDETFSRTNLGAMKVGDVVNLERPMALGDRLGGHLVLGHVDAVGEAALRVGIVVGGAYREGADLARRRIRLRAEDGAAIAKPGRCERDTTTTLLVLEVAPPMPSVWRP